MIEAIGIAVIVALNWVLAFGMATEIDAEKRRMSSFPTAPEKTETRNNRAA